MNLLSQQYIIQKFYEYAGHVKYKKSSHTYQGGCNICREGTSWGKKTRLNYIPDKNIIHCFNCNRTWSPINWIIESSGLSYHDIMIQAREYNFSSVEIENTHVERSESEMLPEDSINLFDQQQVNYFINNKVIKDALHLIKTRRLNTAINKPNAIYISLTDYIHKNRLILPFYDYTGKIIWYQTRAIYKEDEKDRPKYLSKLNGDRTVFGINNINEQLDYLFIFEGPIDSLFVTNGLAMGGISMSEHQEEQMKRYRLYNKIWILDNQLKDNKEVKKQNIKLLEQGERVFLWPNKFNGIKDINELCIKIRKDNIQPNFFIDNSYKGDLGLANMLKLT